jgi:hypothetical protein
MTMMCLAETAVDSEESTGRDAFRLAALAVTEAQKSAKGVWQPALVQSQLEKQTKENESPDGKKTIFDEAGLYKLNDRTAVNRIQMIDVNG